MFLNREDAAVLFAKKFAGRPLRNPIVLAIPRGGVVTGAVLARELNADLEVIVSRKLRTPDEPELALGAVAEGDCVCMEIDPAGQQLRRAIAQERQHQLAEIRRLTRLFRSDRPMLPCADRTVIVTDDGVATGCTMIAALKCASSKNPHELIAATPVIARDRLGEVEKWCDEVVYLQAPDFFWSVSQFYEDFRAIDDEAAAEWFHHAAGHQLEAITA